LWDKSPANPREKVVFGMGVDGRPRGGGAKGLQLGKRLLAAPVVPNRKE